MLGVGWNFQRLGEGNLQAMDYCMKSSEEWNGPRIVLPNQAWYNMMTWMTFVVRFLETV